MPKVNIDLVTQKKVVSFRSRPMYSYFTFGGNNALFMKTPLTKENGSTYNAVCLSDYQDVAILKFYKDDFEVVPVLLKEAQITYA